MDSSLQFDVSGKTGRSGALCARLLCRRLGMSIVVLALILGLSKNALAGVTASILGTVRDQSGAVIADAQVKATNTETHVSQVLSTNDQGFYTFPALQPGKYEVTISVRDFKAFRQTGIVLNVNDAITIDVSLQIGHADEVVTVASEALQVETTSTQMGEVIEDQQVTAVPLNGRSFTDLLALQPGVANTNSEIGGGSSSNNNFQSGGFMLPNVSGSENTGNQSVNGMRESANGYLLNGMSVQEYAFSGTAVVPNLDSLSEFRIITNNFDAEYGNFAGGQINVVTKAGTDQLHGNVFEFLRNTDFDAANYFDQGTRGAFQQNQFGGTAGGPIRKGKVFFFSDYQGTRNVVGISTGLVAVPTTAERGGDFSAPALESAMSASNVVGTYWANTLSNELGYTVTAGEPYYSTGCTSNLQCVFPNAQIPTNGISPISKNVLGLGAIPLGDGQGNFSTSAYSQRLTDDKFSGRVDASTRMGSLFGYYYFDQFSLLNPYPVATVPGFSAVTTGRTQAIDIGDTKSFGSSAVNEARIGFLRYNDSLNNPNGSIKATMSGLGFASSGTPGAMVVLNPATQGIPEMDFENFNIGVPSRVLAVIENTFQGSDNYRKLIGTHSLTFGGAYHFTQLAEQLQNVENGYFMFNQTLETGVDFADFLIGAPGLYEQAWSPFANTRSYYLGAFAQDSWRARSNLTLNYGVRWDVITPWWEAHNELATVKLNDQSVVFPNSPLGWVFPGDPGISRTIAPIRYNNFSPRLGLAYSPSSNSGFLGKLLGSAGHTSIRLAYGMYYTAFEGAYDFSLVGDEPFGDWYAGYAPSFANPFQTRSSGAIAPNPFPYAQPPTNVSASNPDPNVSAATFGQIDGFAAFNPANRVPYAEQYEMSIQRQISADNLLTISYVGTQGHRLLVTQEANPVNQAACLADYEANPASPTCGPNTEPNSMRVPFGVTGNSTSSIGATGYMSAIGPSSYNSLQVSFRHQSGPLQLLIGYTYSKAMDDASGFGEMVNPFNIARSSGLSSYDIPQNFVVSYTYLLPIAKMGGPKMLVDGWRWSGITTFSNGLPVYIYENDDRSLLGTDDSGPLPIGIDVPNYSGGPIKKLNPRKLGNAHFGTSGFSMEPIGQIGTSRRSFFIGPGLNNFNMELSKDISFSERYALQFRAEFFNVFNHTQFQGAPQTTGNFDSSEFGQSPAAEDPRIGQLALKLRF